MKYNYSDFETIGTLHHDLKVVFAAVTMLVCAAKVYQGLREADKAVWNAAEI